MMIRIPKRRRDLVRRKKFVDVNQGLGLGLGLKEEGEGTSNRDDKSSSVKLPPLSLVKLKVGTSDSKGDLNLARNGGSGVNDGKLAENGVSTKLLKRKRDGYEGGVVGKGKRKRVSGPADGKEKSRVRFDGSDDLLRDLKKEGEGGHSSVHEDGSAGPSRDKAKKSSQKRRKVVGLGEFHDAAAKEVKPKPRAKPKHRPKPVGDEPIRFSDDEENLEANAARMLSSRFDPSCTESSSFSSSKSKFHAANGSGDLARPGPSAQAKSDSTCGDDAMVLRPRDRWKRKGIPRKRRHFYEVLYRDLDAYWVVNQRTKVFWPSDGSWRIGKIVAYDPEKKKHRVKYDDRDEGWISLQNEKFKLLLFPSEIPCKFERRKRSTVEDKHAYKVKGDATTDNDCSTSNCMESEPIISWLPRSARCKSSSFGIKKKQKTSIQSSNAQSSSYSDVKIDASGSLDLGFSEKHKNVTVRSSPTQGNSDGDIRGGVPPVERFSSPGNIKSPIVYFRRRFRRREQQVSVVDDCRSGWSHANPLVCETAPPCLDSLSADVDMSRSELQHDSSIRVLDSDGPVWCTYDSGLLKLNLNFKDSKLFRFELSFQLPVVANCLLGLGNLWFLHALFMLQHGAVTSVSSVVHLEMLFIDNIFGLTLLLFEGCLHRAVVFVFLVLTVFSQSNQQEVHADQQLPVTSIRLKFSCLRDVRKQIIFAFYNFTKLRESKWVYLHKKLKRHCLFMKQLPLSECTLDNVRALQSGSNRSSVSKSYSAMGLQKSRCLPHRLRIPTWQSANVQLGRFFSNSDEKLGNLPSFSLSFMAAPTFFLSLHLKLLMERSVPFCSEICEPVSLLEPSDNDDRLVDFDSSTVEDHSCRASMSEGSSPRIVVRDTKMEAFSNVTLRNDAEGPSNRPSECPQDLLKNGADLISGSEKGKDIQGDTEEVIVLALPSGQSDQLSHDKARPRCYPINGITVEIPSFNPVEKDDDTGLQNNPHRSDSAWNMADDYFCSPNPTSARSFWHQSRTNGSSSSSRNLVLGLPDGKEDFLRNGLSNGPKKPRTQVSYSAPFGSPDLGSRNKIHHSKGFSHKRIRRASERRSSEASRSPQRSPEFFSCDANVLVTHGDCGRREYGARVVLELVDHNEWMLAVKLSGATRYSYKAHQFLQPGTVNRYTHAMMWKGGKEWILEFSDRTQWIVFKEMHEECFNRNIRAASVKNIPIPGVRLIEESEDNSVEVLFVRPSPKYYRQIETDVDLAMDPTRVLYDMDSDDEQWIGKIRSSDVCQSGSVDISDEIFEKMMDVFEKVAYSKQRDDLTSDELEEFAEDVGTMESVKIIYDHWREKRRKKGMPLIRHLQPPLWKKYQQQVKEWEQATLKTNSSGCQEKATPIDKPPMFAFCLKPRGLDLPNRGSKQRSHRKLSVGGSSTVFSGDPDGFQSLGRKLNGGCALNDEKLSYHGYGSSDSSPLFQASTRVFSPRDATGVGYFSLSNDGPERNDYPKLYRNKSKKIGPVVPSDDHQPFASYSPGVTGKRNTSFNKWPRHMHYQPEGPHRHNMDQLDPSDLDEFRLRDASSAAQHAVNMAKLKRERAQRLLYRADLAIHKAAVSLMTAEAVKACYEEQNNGV